MDPVSAGIGAGGQLLGGLIGGFMGSRQQNDWYNKEAEFRNALAGRADQNQQTMKDEYFSPAREYAMNQMYPLNALLSQGYGQNWDATQGYGAAMADPSRLGFGNGGVGDTAAQMFMGGGSTPDRDFVSKYLQNIAGDDNTARQKLGTAGMNLMDQQGQTDFTGGLKNAGTLAAANQGYNPYLQTGMESALGVLNSPQSRNASQAADMALQGFGKSAVLPPEQAAAIAKEGALSDFDKQATKLRAQNLARGGGPGANVAAGSQGAAEAETNLDRLKLGNDSYRQALVGQQGLNLQEKGLNAQMIPQLEGLRNQNILGGLGSIGSLNNSATQNLGTNIEGGLGALGQETNRFNMGSGMLNNYLGTQMQALGQLEGNATGAQNAALGGGNLYNSMQNNYAQNYGAGIGANNNMINNYNQNLVNSSLNPLMNMGGQYAGLAGNYIGNLGSRMPGQSAWSQ